MSTETYKYQKRGLYIPKKDLRLVALRLSIYTVGFYVKRSLHLAGKGPYVFKKGLIYTKRALISCCLACLYVLCNYMLKEIHV